MPSVHIHPLTQSDISTFVDIELEAFRSHPRMPMLFPRGYTPDLYAFYVTSKTNAFHDPNVRMWKAVGEGSGEVVGCLQMTIKMNVPPMEENSDDGTPMDGWPQAGNWAMRQWFARNGCRMEREAFAASERGYFVVDFLLVHPRHQGKGIGTQLLAVATKEADRRNFPVGLESTPSGLRLYKRAGFKELETIKADMRDFGWTEPYDPEAAKRVWMVREYSGGDDGME